MVFMLDVAEAPLKGAFPSQTGRKATLGHMAKSVRTSQVSELLKTRLGIRIIYFTFFDLD